MKRILFCLIMTVVLAWNVKGEARLMQGDQVVLSLGGKQGEGKDPDVLDLTKKVSSYWSNFVKSTSQITLAAIQQADKGIQETIQASALYKKDKALANYVAWASKLRSFGSVKDKKLLEFAREYDLSNPMLTKTADPMNTAFAYIGLVEKLEGKITTYSESNRTINFEHRVKMILTIADADLRAALLRNTFDFARRYNAYESWMTDLQAEFDKKIADEKLKADIKAFAQKFAYLTVGGQAPDFELVNAKGEKVKLSDFRGKVLVIDVWGTWCGGCVRALPTLIKMRDKYKNNSDVVFMTIAFEAHDTYKQWQSDIVKYNISDMICLYSCKKEPNGLAFQEAYNLMGAPRYFIVDRDGVFRLVYAPHTADAEFEQILQATLKK